MNKELSGKLDRYYLSSKLFFGKKIININFNVYILYYFLPSNTVLQLYPQQ